MALAETLKMRPRRPRPDAEWVCGDCPNCGGPTVRNTRHLGGRGDVVYEECWRSLTEPVACVYRERVG